MMTPSRREFLQSVLAGLALGRTALLAQENNPGRFSTVDRGGSQRIKESLAKAAEPSASGQIEQYKVGNCGCDWWHNLQKQDEHSVDRRSRADYRLASLLKLKFSCWRNCTF